MLSPVSEAMLKANYIICNQREHQIADIYRIRQAWLLLMPEPGAASVQANNRRIYYAFSLHRILPG
jgi:hypothetical protein